MTERDKYAEIYGSSRPVTAEDRSKFGKIWRRVWGDDLPYELAPTNFITWADLRRIWAELCVGADSRFLDLGCGGGGPGLWVAEQTGASVIGIDSSPEGCIAARRRAASRFGGVTAEYHIADMTATMLPNAMADAAMSIDAVQLVPRRIAAFREVARLLRSSSRFVLTTWDHPGEVPQEALLPGRELVPDSRPLLEEAGFRVLTYERVSSWEERAIATYRAMLEQREIVAAVAGEALVREAEWGVLYGHHSAHVFIVCDLLA
jgi:SAM-dependent methyltransferase